MTRMLLLGKHYQKLESIRSCDTLYRKSTRHTRWDQIAKIKWYIYQMRCERVAYVALYNLSSVNLEPPLKKGITIKKQKNEEFQLTRLV